ncbi:hypothetical protein [Flammeovirga sp. OC4]|uniref:hypothetical protein n=1 Tax=Flammeovirga sp. OC4 TaxID=1382345 RepID=UPI0005C603D9|nr:hypothetical protein [Flammeovirga sp. OC4]
MKQSFLTLCFIFYGIFLQAQTKVSQVFSNHMVLQQQTEVKLWGWDKANQSINIRTSWGAKAKVVTSKEGRWETLLETPRGSFKPEEIKIKGSSLVEIKDVLIGEVWLASGQSNMQMPLEGYVNQPVLFSKEAITDANNFNAPNGITSFSEDITGFEVAGDDFKFYPATAKIVHKEIAVLVWSDQVKQPKYVRYAFKNFHKSNLFGVSGLPVFPFRSDAKVE